MIKRCGGGQQQLIVAIAREREFHDRNLLLWDLFAMSRFNYARSFSAPIDDNEKNGPAGYVTIS